MKMKIIEFIKSKKFLYSIGGFFIFILLMNYIIMPWYVSGKEVVVPRVVGMNQDNAAQLLDDRDLKFVIADERYDERYPKGTIIFQKPEAGAVVKEGRRIYLFISGGQPLVKVPLLKGKSIRDAQLSLNRLGLEMGDTIKLQSDQPRGIIIDQQYYEGSNVKKGSKINVTISMGSDYGKIRVPDLLRKVNYQPSESLLPNTVIDQYPSKDSMVAPGDSVDVFVTKGGVTPDEVKEK
jgi:serine/threonine-protein kinase